MRTIVVLLFVAALILMNCNKTTQAIPVDTESEAASTSEAPIAHILPIHDDGPHPPTPPKSHKGKMSTDDDSSPVEIGVISIIALEGVATTLSPDSSAESSSSTTAASHHHSS